MAFERTTEAPSRYDHIEQMSVAEVLQNIHREDLTVAHAVGRTLDVLEKLIEGIVHRMQQGGRLFYIGAGTSGRLGVVDASECPPSFGVPHGLVVGIIAGGDTAIRQAVEFAEDDLEQGWKDLREYLINEKDSVIGITASGTTPYVMGVLERCKQHGILTGCITCNSGSPSAALTNFPIEVVTGPEFVTGSTRMKAGTAQKMVLNMLSTSIMIRLGRVQGNRMVDMQLSNEKLIDRGTRMVMDATGLNEKPAAALLASTGSVRKAIEQFDAKSS
jgi:N-acetylmuramic acid 6-phosphate etherase